MKENILFAMLKDKPVLSHQELKKKYPNVNVSDLRLRIINYQVITYGYQIDKNIRYVDKYDVDREKRNAKSRRKYWRDKKFYE